MGDLIGYFIGSFIGAGLMIAIVTGLVKWLLTKIGWPKNEQSRVFTACLIPTVFSLFAASEPAVAIINFMAGTVVFLGYAVRLPKSKKTDTDRCGRCGHGIQEKQKFCVQCGTQIDRALPNPTAEVKTEVRVQD